MNDASNLESWIAEQAGRSSAAMERAISATQLVRRRRVFGQTVVPAVGSVLASPAIADWDPEPDYFFHWVRDSAIAMRSVADCMEAASDAAERERWGRHFQDFVRFSLALCDLDGAAFLASSRHRAETHRDYRKFLRPDAELRELRGEALLGEPRFNADGTIDFLRWSRPQYDGPALRALACLRYLSAGRAADDGLERLLRLDLQFTLDHADQPCIGPWEEADQNAHHYYVAVVQLGALLHGRHWLGDLHRAAEVAEERLRAGLEQHWSPQQGVYAAIRGWPADTAEDSVDACQLLAVLDADLPAGPHSVEDPRVHATQDVIERLFARELPINQARPSGRAPALGRSRGDRYFGGGAWYPTTLAAAALCYRLAQRRVQDRGALVRRGDAFMATVRALTPADGALSEQVDRETGAQTSARHLTWSYAAFVSTALERARTVGA